MKRSEFEAVVAHAVSTLPAWVRGALDNIQIHVVDAPDPELVAEVDAGSEPGSPDGELLGLYVGVPLPERGVEYAGELPDVVYIFREPHLAMGLEGDALRDEIAKTLLHELAHHFGIDDDHLDDIGWG